MRNRKLIAFIMALCMTASLASCGSVDSSADDVKPAGNSVVSADDSKDNGSQQDDSKEPETNNAGDTSKPDSNADNSGDGFVEVGEPLDSEFIKANFDFSAELFKKGCAEAFAKGENAMVSPYSVMQALGLVANGADGETLAELEKLLGGSLKLSDINKNLAAQITAARKSENVKFSVANSLWAEQNTKLKESFLSDCLKYLAAESYSLPFDKSAVERINSWVNEKTDSMIPEIIDDLSKDDRSVLINCIAFKGKWDKEYKESQIIGDQTFTNAKGEEEKCTMLQSGEDKYIEGEGVKGFIKNYQGGRYAFAALLPDEGKTVAELAESLDGDKLSKLLNNASDDYKVSVKMPEFKFDFENRLADQLKAMGIPTAFMSNADFSKMSDEALYIGEVIHKTHIELDREGTKAAAATAVVMKVTSVEPAKDTKEVTLDRPFMFAIIDKENGTPIFIGAVNSVK